MPDTLNYVALLLRDKKMGWHGPLTDFKPESYWVEYHGYSAQAPSSGFHEQYVFTFGNGYGASVIRGAYTHGGDTGGWELAVLNKDRNICYTTPITEDVVGHIPPEGVHEYLTRINALEEQK